MTARPRHQDDERSGPERADSYGAESHGADLDGTAGGPESGPESGSDRPGGERPGGERPGGEPPGAAQAPSQGSLPPRAHEDGDLRPEYAAVFNYVSQSFNGPLHAPQAQFGTASGNGGTATGAQRRATGRIGATEVDALLASYVRPTPFDGAAVALAEDKVVVLTAPQGSGKRSGAVALLREVAGNASLVVLSPDNSLEQLAERPFEQGTGYVLLDRVNEQSGAARTADFDWRRVRDQVRAHGAHLVVTTAHPPKGTAPESVQHVAWAPPDLESVLRLRLRTGGHEEEEALARAVQLMPAECTVGEVAAGAARILAGAAPEAVWADYGSQAARPVREWFAVDRSRREIAEITTLAFVPGVGRRTFEALQELLEPCIEAAFPPEPEPQPRSQPVSAPGSDGTPAEVAPAYDPTVGRPYADRRRSLGRNALVTTEKRAPGQGTPVRTVVVFPSPQYRLWVLEELWAHHSTAYWDGVREWVDQIVATGPEGDMQASVAMGLALLARPAFDEVAISYLLPWAGGTAGRAGRLMAVQVLAWMVTDSTLAPVVLALVRGWAQSGNPELRTTASLAFSVVGLTFPTDAVKWLWHLISQAAARGASAAAAASTGGPGVRPADREVLPWEPVQALAQLFAFLVEYGEDVRPVLDVLVYRLDKQARTRVTGHLKLVTFATVLRVLAARVPQSGTPTLSVLAGRDSPGTASAAELLAGVLCFRPYRGTALSVLHSVLRGLPAACEDPCAAAERLGRQTAAHLAPHERTLLAESLRRVATQPGLRSADVVDAFLAAVRRTEDKGLRRDG
ncbi:hypothetical protein ABZZ20_24435 [Streptomyces sp. NPDC006430]|uniref:hypothetical protein n=1 Tax=Streptomyces sp. NPDC006430 TaxID=3154299 RepID=UPI0033B83424